MALTGDVQVPAVGKVPKKTGVIALAAVAGLIVIYYVRKKPAAAAAAATSTDQYPPDGTTGNPSDPYSTDPATGQTYGDEAAGSGGTFGAFGGLAGGQTGNYDPGTGEYYDPATGQYDLSAPYTGTTPPGSGGPPFSGNSAWENWVILQLQANDPNIDAGALQDALGLYLDGQPVSAAQKTLILDATATGGNPPVAGTGNYPPNVRLNGTKGPTPPPKEATVTVPDVTGMRGEDAKARIEAAGLKYAQSPVTTPRGAVTKVIAENDPKAGAKVARGTTVHVRLSYSK